MRKTALGLGLVEASIAIKIQALKLYVGDHRSKMKIAMLNRVIDKIQQVIDRYSSNPLNININLQ